MKSISCLVVLILNLIVLVNCKTFLNFIPFKNPNCSGKPTGLGFGGIVNTCLTYDDNTNWIFKANKNGEVSFTGYYSKGGVQELCEYEKFNTTDGVTGDCVPGSTAINFFNSYYLPLQGEETYYKLQVTYENTHIEPKSYTSTLMYEECTEDNILAVSYFTSPTNVILVTTQNIVTFECSAQNVPVTSGCDTVGSCNTNDDTAKCVDHIPFFNSSTNYPFSSSDSTVSAPNFNNVYCS